MQPIKPLWLILLFFNIGYSQKENYPVFTIPDSLKTNANAIIRLQEVNYSISSQRNLNIKTKRVVSILNKEGLSAINAFENYNKVTTIKNISASIQNELGFEIKKLKKSDFKDHTASDEGTVFSDSRVIYLDYTPIQYPFTIIYESEVTTSNTAFIKPWMPIDEYYVSLEKSVFKINYLLALGFQSKEINFENYSILKKVVSNSELSYEINQIKALKPENLSIESKIFPMLKMSLEYFNLEGIDGNAKNWKEFGKWYYDKILTGTTNLSEETKNKIKTVVGNEKDPIKAAKIIYQFVQDKSRYVSIQVGIGGFKPMFANDVDRLGYGDCKALSNYTRALLEVVNIPSYNTILFGSHSKKNIDKDLVSMQGNHMILCIPNGEKYEWLECTSQVAPFGYQGTFTDDREVIILKPEGGEIVHTKNYLDTANSQVSKGEYTLLENGNLMGAITIISEGTQYEQKYDLPVKSKEDLESFYKDYWNYISNLKIVKTSFLNDKEKISFTENVSINSENYAKQNGNEYLFVLNTFNQYNRDVKKVRNRKTAFEIQRGFLDTDEITITLPNGYSPSFIPENIELQTKFGKYSTSVLKKENGQLLYTRSILINKGDYKNSEYEDYLKFLEKIARNDQAKIILTKK